MKESNHGGSGASGMKTKSQWTDGLRSVCMSLGKFHHPASRPDGGESGRFK
jgi:hypothetical protein